MTGPDHARAFGKEDVVPHPVHSPYPQHFVGSGRTGAARHIRRPAFVAPPRFGGPRQGRPLRRPRADHGKPRAAVRVVFPDLGVLVPDLNGYGIFLDGQDFVRCDVQQEGEHRVGAVRDAPRGRMQLFGCRGLGAVACVHMVGHILAPDMDAGAGVIESRWRGFVRRRHAGGQRNVLVGVQAPVDANRIADCGAPIGGAAAAAVRVRLRRHIRRGRLTQVRGQVGAKGVPDPQPPPGAGVADAQVVGSCQLCGAALLVRFPDPGLVRVQRIPRVGIAGMSVMMAIPDLQPQPEAVSPWSGLVEGRDYQGHFFQLAGHHAHFHTVAFNRIGINAVLVQQMAMVGRHGNYRESKTGSVRRRHFAGCSNRTHRGARPGAVAGFVVRHIAVHVGADGAPYADGGVGGLAVVNRRFAAALFEQQRHLPLGGHRLGAQDVAGFRQLSDAGDAQIGSAVLLNSQAPAGARPAVQLAVAQYRRPVGALQMVGTGQGIGFELAVHLPADWRLAGKPVDEPEVVQIVGNDARIPGTLRPVHPQQSEVQRQPGGDGFARHRVQKLLVQIDLFPDLGSFRILGVGRRGRATGRGSRTGGRRTGRSRRCDFAQYKHQCRIAWFISLREVWTRP